MNVTGAVPTPQMCSICRGFFTGPHYCPVLQPPLGFGAFPMSPLTEERVREIVREELTRSTADAAKTGNGTRNEGGA